jgi:large subunit ribosomal protein L10
MPSPINKLMLKEVKALVDKTPSFIVIDPSRLTSGDTLKLRSQLRSVGARVKVAKVAILSRAIPADAAKLLEGGRSSIGLVLASDLLGAAKAVQELAKEDKLAVKGAFMDGKVMDANSVKRLAELPSKQTLYGMLVNLLASPIVGFARVIAEIEKKQKPAAG